MNGIVAEIGCTAIGVDSEASVDGSAMAGMNVDCAQCDNRLTYIESRDYTHVKNATRPVFANFGAYPRLITRDRSSIYLPENNPGLPVSVSIGSIQQPSMKTFGYWESTLPLMNEAGLTIGESSCGTKLVGSPEYLLDMTELVRIAAERCATSRCAVDTLGALADEYGFMAMKNEITPGTEKDGLPAFDDAGEALIFADTSGEVWVFHITGGWPGVSKATWAAQRVPKGHVTVLANSFTIGVLPIEPNEEFRFNSKIRETAIAAKIWNESIDGPLHFTKVFGMDIVTFQRKPDELPIPLYTSLRTWRVYDLIAPSLRLEVSVTNTDYPFSIKPDSQISHREVMKILGDYYADSEFDLREGIMAGPFGTPYRLEGGNAKPFAQTPRAISIPRTSYSVLGQSRPVGVPSVAWYAIDQPMTSVYIPLLSTVSSVEGLADSYQFGNLWEFDRKSAFWAFDFVSNWMNMNWRNMSSEEVFPLQTKLQNEIDFSLAQPHKDEAEWQKKIQEDVVNEWWRMADRCIVKYNDGYYTRVGQDVFGTPVEKIVIGKSYGLPDWFDKMIGQSADVHPVWVQPWNGEENLNNYGIRDTNSLPTHIFNKEYTHIVPNHYDYTDRSWSHIKQLAATTPQTDNSWTAIIMSICFGIAIGMFLSKMIITKKVNDKYSPLLA